MRITCQVTLEFMVDQKVSKGDVEHKINRLITHGTLRDMFNEVGLDLFSGEAKVTQMMGDDE